MLPVGSWINGVLVEFHISNVANDATALHSCVIFVEETGAADEGGDSLESLVDGGHGGDGATHGEAGEAEFGGIHFSLFFEEGEGAAPCEREHEPIRVAGADDGVNAVFIGMQGAFPSLAESFCIKTGTLGGVNFTPGGAPFIIRIEVFFEGASEPVDIDGGESLGGKVVASISVGSLSPTVTPDEGGVLFSVLREAVVGRNTGVGTLEGADLKSD